MKGNYFNWYIKQLLINNLDSQKYLLNFEGFSKYTNEKYDFMVINKINNKKLIGMNQLDFWSGGHQLNRAGSYIFNYKEQKNVRIISVIGNYIQIKSEKSKIFNLFKVGFEKNILTYPKNLINIIKQFLN